MPTVLIAALATLALALLLRRFAPTTRWRVAA
jgi:hypothetical protein